METRKINILSIERFSTRAKTLGDSYYVLHKEVFMVTTEQLALWG